MLTEPGKYTSNEVSKVARLRAYASTMRKIKGTIASPLFCRKVVLLKYALDNVFCKCRNVINNSNLQFDCVDRRLH